MVRKEKKYHYIYKTTNLLSGRYYIGMHSTNELDDGYMGSGNRIRLAIRKHGKENFKREILEFVDNREELYLREEEIVNLDEIAKVDCMNLIVGGTISGFKDEEHMMKCSKAGNETLKMKRINDKTFYNEWVKKLSKKTKKAIDEGRITIWKDNYDWTDKKHSNETKKKMCESRKGTGSGETNSQYGTCWVTNGKENKKIKKSEHIPEGWSLGRKIN